MVVPPSAKRSLHPEIENNGDAEEKGETLLKRDDLHGAPPRKDTSLFIEDKLNVALATAKSLETTWRFSGEFLKVFCQFTCNACWY
jgi:hypothetical protein